MWQSYGIAGFDAGTGGYFVSMDATDDPDLSMIGYIPRISNVEMLMEVVRKIFPDSILTFNPDAIERLRAFGR
jgi:hypothetical protein